MRSHPVASIASAVVLALGLAVSLVPVGALAEETDGWDASVLQLTVQSETSRDVGNGSITCDQAGTLYRITGTSSTHTITVRGGTAENPVMVDLAGVTMKFQAEKDGDSTEASPLTIEDGAYAIIYIGRDSSSVIDTLTGGNEHGVGKNTGYAGICVKSGAHVTIAGQGTLNVTGGGVEYGAAAIGGNYNDDVTDLTIDGSMTINATGGYSAPGIGSGRDGELYSLVINSGTIHATGGKYAPGIGAGDAVGTGSGGTMHSLTINGGTITATGGEEGAGIGGSEGGGTDSIAINGGTITATGGEEGAGIGGGSGGDVSSIAIYGGTITATGGANGAGIGGGKGADSGTITIAEASAATLGITATGGTNGAGIGSAGHDSDRIDITLDGGSIHAVGGDSAAGIGAGNADAGEIRIEGSGLVSAKGGKQGCGIGAGEDSTATGITIEGTSRQLTINAEALTVVPTDETALNMGEWYYANKNAAIGSGRTECGPITISNAVVNAAANGYGADIGGGKNHGWNHDSVVSISISNCAVTSVDFDKNVPNDKVAPSIGSGTDGNVGTIEIYNSDVTGAGIGAASENDDHCNSVDSITIAGSTVSAIRQDVDWDKTNSRSQAAGIGSGIKGDIGSIHIEDSTVTAQGVGGGAGIGSGGVSGESFSEGADPGISDVGTITIMRSNITATGSSQGVPDSDFTSGGPGIGLGFAVGGSGTIHSILIDTCTSVVATGAWGAAGIGTSCGSSFTSGDDGDGNVTITNSGVTATGGYGAAGIGAGAQVIRHLIAHGGDARIIKITGSSAVTATGGYGAAGIGGGLGGGVDTVTIALERVDLSIMHTQYVTATGGSGAAGIGSGAGGQDVGSVTIQSGYVTAQGGTDLDGEGTGAGIGGGNAKGALKNLSISGGFIKASAGSSDAYDIGCGGTNGALSTEQNGTFTISGGTVLATNIGYAKTMTVTGGSVLANLTNAYDASHNHVYRTTITLPIGANTPADVSSFVDGYGTNDIYSDADRKVYLYRTTTDAFKASADVTTTYQTTAYHFIGQTLADGLGMLKIQPQFSFKDPETTPVVGDTFQIYVDDSELTSRWGDCIYAISGCVSETNNPPSNARHKGAYVSLIANSIGTYTVTATCAVPTESADVYWPVTATYTGAVTQQAGTISITEDPSKIYDGQAVADPSVTTTGDGAVTYTYYSGTDVSVAGAKLNAAPVDQGTYTVVASMAGTDHYTAASVSESFTITPRPITLGLSASLSEDKGTATLSATVLNAVSAQGDVDFTITKPDGTTTAVRGKIAASGDTFVAQASFTGVGAGTYNVVAEYSPDMSGDYSCADTASASFNNEYVNRSINVDSSSTVAYGDPTFELSATASTSEGAADHFAYEVASDEFAAYGFNPTILVDAAGNVTPINAGVATVKITLTDSNNVYAPATAYVKVTVTRAELRVTPYVKDSNSNTITEATYGSLGGITYGLTFDGLKGEDTADTFTAGHGHLEAVPLATTAGTGSYSIGIKRVGDGSVIIDGNAYYNVFVSRNYKIIEAEGGFIVGPATLKVEADATGTWGGTEPTYGVSLSGFVLSDTASSVFSTQPTATLDTKQTGGKSFSELEPGTYDSAIAVDAGTQNKNENGNENYKVANVPGTLTVAKADPALTLMADTKPFDGKAVAVATTTAPTYDGTVSLTYYQVASDGTRTALNEAPSGVGSYVVVASAPETSVFASGTEEVAYSITKASPGLTISAESKTYDGSEAAVTSSTAVGYDGTVKIAYYKSTEVGATSGGTLLESPPVEPGSYYVDATATGSAQGGFSDEETVRAFSIDKLDPQLAVSIDSKPYDGSAAEATTTHGEGYDGTVSVTYYRLTGTPRSQYEKIDAAPTDVGDYGVVVTATATSHYAEASVRKAFSITSVDISICTISSVLNTIANGSAYKPVPSVTSGDVSLAEGTDFTVAYLDSYGSAVSDPTEADTYTLTVTGTGNYTGTVMLTFDIAEKAADTRLWGAGALDTMEKIVDEAYPEGTTSATVILCTADGYWDALCASGIAGMANAPVILTAANGLSSQAADEISRLKPTTIIVVGGTSAVTDDTAQAAADVADNETRFVRMDGGEKGGAVETAVAVYQKAKDQTGSSWSDTAFVVTNQTYQDALSISPYAYAKHCPIFMTSDATSISQATLDALKSGGFSRIVIVGGTKVIPDSIATKIKNATGKEPERLAGAGAIETSLAVANWECDNGFQPDSLAIANRDGYWDALCGAALCGKHNSVILLVEPSNVNKASLDGFVKAHSANITKTYILGGTAAVPQATVGYLESLLKM